MSGYMGKILRVNLTSKKLTDEKFDEKTQRQWMGGTGLALKILYDEVPPGLDPFDPENRIIFSIGPLTGTAVGGSGTYNLGSKSPLTGFAAMSQANGWFGARLKQAGYDAIIFQGASDKPVYLWINDGVPDLRDAEKLWGKTTHECEETLKQELNRNASVASIGPAGENLMRGSCVMNDYGHVASSGGLGAVLGSKKLKAVAVYGKQKILVADQQKLIAAARALAEVNKSALFTQGIAEAGTSAFFAMTVPTGGTPLLNGSSADIPYESTEAFSTLREVFKPKPKPCWACPVTHSKYLEIQDGPHKGLVVEEPENEDCAAWGFNIGNKDPSVVCYLTYLNDGLGMDTKEVGWLVSMCMEAYENGKLTNAQTGGLELKWGNTQAVETLLGQIARREGPLGKVLAEGLVRAAELLNIKDMAYFAKGAGIHVIDVRSMPYNGFDFAVSEMCSGQGNMQGMFTPDPETKDRALEIIVPGVTTPLIVTRVSKAHVLNSLVMCFFNANIGMPPILFEPHVCDCIRAATGWNDYTKEEAFDFSERIINLSRVFNLRNGLSIDDDIPSEKVLGPCLLGPNAGTTLKPGYMGLLKTYYRWMGWDDRTGKPSRATLKRLGLGFCIKEIWGC